MDGDPRYGEVKQSDQGHIIGQGWSWEEESGLLIPSLVPPAGCIEGCIWLKKKKKKGKRKPAMESLLNIRGEKKGIILVMFLFPT